MCMTHERLTNLKRQDGHSGEAKPVVRQMLDTDSEGDEEPNEPLHSAKRCFFAKAMSRVLDYGSDYQLLHFAYDLVTWCRVASCKNKLQGKVPLRVALKDQSYSPLY